MSSAVKWITVQRGTVLQQAGTPLHGLFFIKEGEVAILVDPKQLGATHPGDLSSHTGGLTSHPGPGAPGPGPSHPGGLPHSQQLGLSSPGGLPSCQQLLKPMRQVAVIRDGDFFGEDALTAGGVHQVGRVRIALGRVRIMS